MCILAALIVYQEMEVLFYDQNILLMGNLLLTKHLEFLTAFYLEYFQPAYLMYI